MDIDVLIEDHRWDAIGFDGLAETACSAALQHVLGGAAAVEVSVLACNDRRIAELNADFRGKPTPTNVLSWPSQERGAETDGAVPDLSVQDPELGDIAIAYDTCLSEAEAASRPLTSHATHLLVHGTLHLLGFDHERDADAALMERIEIEILGNLGLENPYASS